MLSQGVPQRRPAFFFLLVMAGGRQQTFEVAVQEQGQKEPLEPSLPADTRAPAATVAF